MDVNIPEVRAEMERVFARYERALVTNDIATLNEMFWRSPLTMRFVFGTAEYGYDAIAGSRMRVPAVDLARALERTIITTYGRDVATAATEFTRTESGRRGHQSQTWVRMGDGWKVVAAHVAWA